MLRLSDLQAELRRESGKLLTDSYLERGRRFDGYANALTTYIQQQDRDEELIRELAAGIERFRPFVTPATASEMESLLSKARARLKSP